MTDPRVTRRVASGVSQGVSYRNVQASQYERFPAVFHETATLHVVNLDAAEFVKSVNESYDVLIMDFPDPNSPDLAKLYGRPFYDHLEHMLDPGGVIVQQSGSCVQAREAFLCIGRTLTAAGFGVVPYHDNVPSFGEWGWWIAVKGRSASETRAALSGLEPLQSPTRYLTSDLVAASLVFGKDQLASNHHDFTSLTEPRVYHYHLQGWNIEEFP